MNTKHTQAKRDIESDERFQQLFDLASEGNQEAIGDLWLEYGFQFEGGAA